MQTPDNDTSGPGVLLNHIDLRIVSYRCASSAFRYFQGLIMLIIYLVAGARPNFMKIAPIVGAIEAHGGLG